ncbi:hypothetical protein IC229_07920 [Spirosoma sp. BT702]|uniref:Lipoprotein n=1 Tax=Spirosoma profusum TaxID=2771354 RepID=A0A927ATL7_9BACT|nr:hypothetical protein [Spirosoma profusum]MBD2700557.1 hypothetical protein [Spirosoma profusum]
MRRQQIHPYLFIIGAAWLLSSCFNEPNYSNTPEIDFKGIFKYPIAPGKGVGQSKRDSVVITIGFRDGDGNLGNSLPPSKADSTKYASNGKWGNYQIRTFRLINKKFEELPLSVNTTLIFPEFTPGKPKGAIEGTLDFNQTFQYGTSFTLYPTKFQIKIRDRDLNESNVIETDTVTVPFPNGE